MTRLPDLEGMAVFARVAELRSFSAAAEDLMLSKATVSKIVTRLETRLGTRLFHRTSRRLSLTDTGRDLVERATSLLGDAEALQDAALSHASQPRGLVRLAAPMSFGMTYVAPALPKFLQAYPDVTIALHLSDQTIDLVGLGVDVALRIAALPDSSLRARRLCPIRRMLVGSPDYFEREGRPTHPLQLAHHSCLGYAYLPTPDLWRFTHRNGEQAAIRPVGRMRANNGDSFTAALCAGLGVALQPEFMVWRELAEGRLVEVLADWQTPTIALHLVTPPGGHRPARVERLLDFFAELFREPSWQRPTGGAPA